PVPEVPSSGQLLGEGLERLRDLLVAVRVVLLRITQGLGSALQERLRLLGQVLALLQTAVVAVQHPDHLADRPEALVVDPSLVQQIGELSELVRQALAALTVTGQGFRRHPQISHGSLPQCKNDPSEKSSSSSSSKSAVRCGGRRLAAGPVDAPWDDGAVASGASSPVGGLRVGAWALNACWNCSYWSPRIGATALFICSAAVAVASRIVAMICCCRALADWRTAFGASLRSITAPEAATVTVTERSGLVAVPCKFCTADCNSDAFCACSSKRRSISWIRSEA